ncbi:unnamed protein product, partial [marine sediment metagenome]
DEYFAKLFCPATNYSNKLLQDKAKNLRELVNWKQNILARFSTVKIKTILVDGIKEGKIKKDGIIKVKVLLFSGKLTRDELKAELILVQSDGKRFIAEPIITPLKPSDTRESGILTYTLEYQVVDTGFYSYGIRVYPQNPLLLHPANAGVVYWG